MVPSGSEEPEPLKDTARLVAVGVNAAVGATFAGGATTVTEWTTVAVFPVLSVTVSRTV